MVKVLHVIGKMDRAGAETLIMNIYRMIDRRMVQFDFLVFSKEEADYDKEIKKLGGKIYHMPMFKGYNYLKLNRYFEKFFKAHPYNIVHGHLGSLAPLYLAKAKKYGAYVIAHSHSTKSNQFWGSKIYYILNHRVIHIADYFMACSMQAGIDRYGERIVRQNNFKIINNGIDVEKYKYSIERHRNLKKVFKVEDKFILGHVGRFSQEKNHKFLIEIFDNIHKKIENAVLFLVGRGSLEKEIRQLVIEKGLERKVFFLGIREDIPDLMNLFDVFVFPSVFEGLGIAGVEAQASGLPCFFSDGIAKEAIITDNVYVYSLGAGASEWSKKILAVLENFERKDRSKVVEEAGFDIRHTALDIQGFYLKNGRSQ